MLNATVALEKFPRGFSEFSIARILGNLCWENAKTSQISVRIPINWIHQIYTNAKRLSQTQKFWIFQRLFQASAMSMQLLSNKNMAPNLKRPKFPEEIPLSKQAQRAYLSLSKFKLPPNISYEISIYEVARWRSRGPVNWQGWVAIFYQSKWSTDFHLSTSWLQM